MSDPGPAAETARESGPLVRIRELHPPDGKTLYMLYLGDVELGGGYIKHRVEQRQHHVRELIFKAIQPLVRDAEAKAREAERTACASIALDLFKSVDPGGRMSHPQRHKWEAGKKIAARILQRSEAAEGTTG